MGENTGGRERGGAPTPPRLVAGGLVAGGRYELLETHGGVAGQAFWKARDKRLGRTVALTFVDPLPGEDPPGSATGVLDRTVALTTVYSDGLARVLDVIRGRSGGIVVSEWIPGRSLAASVADPDPDSAVGAVWGLSDAATRTEEAGLALGLDSPDRVRLTEDGRAVLAFPGVTATADDRGDVRGLGAVLYALLTGTWPLELPEGSGSHEPVDGRPGAAPKDDDDKVLDAAEAGSGVSPESAVLAMRSLDGSAVSSAATVRTMVTDHVGGPVRSSTPTARVTAPGTVPTAATAATGTTGATAGAAGVAGVAGVAAGAAGAGGEAASSVTSSSGSSSHGAASHAGTSPHAGTPSTTPGRSAAGFPTAEAGDSASGAGETGDDQTWGEPLGEPDPDVQKRRWQIMAVSGAAAVVVIVLLSVWMLGALGDDQNDTPLSQQLDAIERAAQESRSADAAPPEESAEESGGDDPDSDSAEASRPATSPIPVSTVTSWQPASANGNAENSSSAPNVIDGDPSTSWSTDTYRDQFGTGPSAYKAGLGLMFTLNGEQEVREVELTSDDDIRFEIRSSDTATPTSLDDTTRLASGRVRDGSATVEIDDPAESGYILVWITRLGTSGTQAYSASITEVDLLG